MTVFSFASSLNKKDLLHDEGVIIYEGKFPHDANAKDEIERKDIILAKIISNQKILGTIESRNKNLEIHFCLDGKSKKIWEYKDYGAVSKITFDESKNLIRFYYTQGIIREKYYLIGFDVKSLKWKKVLIQKGQWYLW